MSIEVNTGTVQVRVRFTDGKGNFSKYFTSDEIDMGSHYDFVNTNNLIGGTNSENLGSIFCDSVYQIEDGETDNKIVQYNIYRKETNVCLAYNSDDTLVYKLSNYDDGTGNVLLFEKINLNTSERTTISLSGEEITSASSMTYRGSNVFIVSSNDTLYTLTAGGVFTVLSVTGITFNSMSVNVGALGCTNGTTLYLFDPNTGLVFGEEAEVPPSVPLEFADNANGVINEFLGAASTGDATKVLVKHTVDETTILYSVCGLNELVQLIVERSFTRRFVEIFYTEASQLFLLTDLVNYDSLTEGTIYYIPNTDDYIPIFRISNTERNNYIGLAWNQDDGYIYRIAEKSFYDEDVDSILSLTKVYNQFSESPEVLSTDLINVNREGVEYTTSDGSFIEDGGWDMYDGGNYLGTNLSTTCISYTHTKQEEGEYEESTPPFVLIADGTVNDGTTWFGSGSNYFTNLYDGLFVLVATGIDIDRFIVGGNLGADGDGFIKVATFEVTVSSTLYTAYFKKVYRATSNSEVDPSVNHLIIVQGDGSGLTHNFSTNTNNDYDEVTGLGSKDKLYYLLFASSDGGEVSTAQATAIATAFLNVVHSHTSATDKLTALNANVENVTDLIPNKFSFTDEGTGESSESMGRDVILNNPDCMVYVGKKENLSGVYEDTFMVASDAGLVFLTVSGEVRYLRSIGAPSFTGMAVLDNIVYAVTWYFPFLIKIDIDTGEFLNENEDTKFDMVVTMFDNPLSGQLVGLANINGELIGLYNYSGDEEREAGVYTISINHITGVAEFIEIMESPFVDISGTGVNPPRVDADFNVNEDEKVRIQIAEAYYGDFDSDNVEAQYRVSNCDGTELPSSGTWLPLELDHMIEPDESNGYAVFDINATGNLTIRLRYPGSAWVYICAD